MTEPKYITMEKIAIIIANYNGRAFLEVSIPAILKSTYSNFNLIVCDDASTDNSMEYLRQLQQQDNRVILLQNETNKGAAATRNYAVTKAEESLLIFLDNDTEVDPGWIEPLIKLLSSDKTIGGVQSTLIDYHNRDTIQLTGTHLIPHVFWSIPLEAGQKVSWRIRESREIIALSAAMAVRKDVFINVKGFDEVLGVYTEDIEFSLRIWISGYRIVSCPESIVYHWTKRVEDRKSMFATKERIYFHLAKNSIRSILKNYELKHVIYYLPVAVFVITARMAIVIKNSDTSVIKGTVKGLVWSLFNFGSTLKVRNEVESIIRKTSDTEIMKKVFTKKNLITIYKEYFT
ncbi:MAG: glycosyltransferase family 2 protein [bacterium]|nr:glycosyltransferase family 2 protein [bacterium]